MTIDLALEYIPRRMEELGFGNRYTLRFRHLVLQATEELILDAQNQFFILVDQPSGITVDSSSGVFDLSSSSVNEMQYEHQGLINIKNMTEKITHIRFIQVIIKHKKTK